MSDIMQLPVRDYIGDGVYVEFNGFDFQLWAEREDGRH